MDNNKTGVNSLLPYQLDALIQYMLNTQIRSGAGRGHPMMEQLANTPLGLGAIYLCNMEASPYPRVYIPNPLWNSWPDDQKPSTRSFLVHLVFWRWMNQYRLCEPNLHISHRVCYRGQNPRLKSENFLLVTQEHRDVNESRKYCWNQIEGLNWCQEGRCPHRPPCVYID
jgi:hypothetical protein